MPSQAFLDEVLRRDFEAFVMRVFQTVSAGDQFAGNWHHKAIAWELKQIELGVSRRLIVNVPPRSLKSIIISVAWPAWLLGHDPRKRIVCVSYSAGLALKHALDCRRVMESAWYRRVFPGARLSGRTAQHDFTTTIGGGRFSTSIDGTLTGRGGDLMIIDDPMNSVDTHSESVRKRVIEFFTGTALSRLNDKNKGAIVLVMQRLHEDDLSGYLLETGGWKHLCLPAIAIEDEWIEVGPGEYHFRAADELLHRDREGAAWLAEQKRNMGSAGFEAQYQQQPVPAAGLMVQRQWLKSYKVAPERHAGDQLVQCWDTATKDGVLNDYSCCVTALVRCNKVYVLDVYRERLQFPALKARAIAMAREYHASVLLIEKAASGEALLQQLHSEEPWGVPTPLGRMATTAKITRFDAQTPKIEAGDLLLPEEAPWLASFLHEILGFPNVRHDDQADALAHLLAWVGNKVSVIEDIPGPILIDGETGMCSDGTFLSDDYDEDFDPWAAF